ncbi:MAG TPA: phosphoribosyltransferase family protein [Verrucomicrobiae bacterium]|nr:phosphoribosyltransferase family protein [Verrucomicrobiae bacterium]
MTFATRRDAGRQLAEFLVGRKVRADLVLGLPRGGVVVAAEVAREMNLPLDVLVVRKIGHPSQREFAVGALAEPDFVFLNEKTLEEFPAERLALEEIIAEEKVRLRRYSDKFHFAGMPSFSGKDILLVDDGLATGATAEIAVHSARRREARRVFIAAPVASIGAIERLQKIADAVEVLFVDKDFKAVGQYFQEFSPTTDKEVISLLRENHAM